MGLVVRGTTYYLRLNVPKALQEIVGRKEFVRSLGTNRCIEAARKARAVAADFEGWLRDITASPASPSPVVVAPAPPHLQETAQTPSPAQFAANASGKTVRDVCEIFLSDPTKNRSEKAASGYWNAVELAEAVLGKSKAMPDIDRQCARDIVATLKWVPSNAKKRFPSLDYRQAAEKGRTGRYRLLGPKSVNDYLIKLSTLSNFAIDEGFISRNPFRGLKVADDVHPRDKRHPFSNEQLVRIFNAPLYRGCQDDEAGYCVPGHALPRRGRFWIPLIGLFSGTGYYSDPFSKWFLRFMKKAGAAAPKTSFHSFRHCFRDAIRTAKLDHEIGLALGGWTSSSGKDVEIASFYGNGHGAIVLKEAIDLVGYSALDLSHLSPSGVQKVPFVAHDPS